jgi:hypothetical protein
MSMGFSSASVAIKVPLSWKLPFQYILFVFIIKIAEMILENEQEEQKPEKLSLRKELKRKRQEHNVLFNNTEREREMPKFDGVHTPALPTVPPGHTSTGNYFYLIF